MRTLRSPTAARIDAPTSLLPVKVTAARTGLLSNAGASTLPRPVVTDRTPAGKPASVSAAARSRLTTGVSVAGLSTTELPAKSAGASLRAGVSSGSFQGVIARMTPTGSYRTPVTVVGRASLIV